MKDTITIWFDMDGTIADLYGVPDWLPLLRAEKATPYLAAGSCVNLSQLAKLLHKAQAAGFQIGIISWLSKESTPSYSEKVSTAKLSWLRRHLPSVTWDEIIIVDYGTNKANFLKTSNDILFDDEEKNRQAWTGKAYEPNSIFTVLKELVASN